MAVLKHIASKSADYGRILEYLLFQHNEESKKPVLDEMGRNILREEFYMDGILCEPMAFDMECEALNDQFNKNKDYNEIKSHHYIISFDPMDVTEKGLTGQMAQKLCMEYARKCFPGHQALVVTHTDGHNHAGNVHTHIIINSLRKLDVEWCDFMERSCDNKAGYKHHLSKNYLAYLKKEVMDMCRGNSLHQVDLLAPAAKRVTQNEYQAKRQGQKRLDDLNREIIADGLKPASTTFRTQKQRIRDAVDDISRIAVSFEDFRSLLSDHYQITVREKRGRLDYQIPGRDKHITERALGTHYGKSHLFEMFEKNHLAEQKAREDYRTDPLAVLYYPSRLQLVVELQTCIKAQQNQAYARKVKVSNLRKMAETLVFLQENHFESRDQLAGSLAKVDVKLEDTRFSLDKVQEELKDINEQIHFTGQYLTNKKTYQQMLKAVSNGLYRKRHEPEIKAYEEARSYLKGRFPDSGIPSMKDLKEAKKELTLLKDQYKTQIEGLDRQKKDLSTAFSNTNAILTGRFMKTAAKEHGMELS